MADGDYQRYLNERARREAAEARLAEVEAERDDAEDTAAHMVEKCGQAIARAEAAESRLAAVQALCERNFNMEDWYEIDANDVVAILEGKAD